MHRREAYDLPPLGILGALLGSLFLPVTLPIPLRILFGALIGLFGLGALIGVLAGLHTHGPPAHLDGENLSMSRGLQRPSDTPVSRLASSPTLPHEPSPVREQHSAYAATRIASCLPL